MATRLTFYWERLIKLLYAFSAYKERAQPSQPSQFTSRPVTCHLARGPGLGSHNAPFLFQGLNSGIFST